MASREKKGGEQVAKASETKAETAASASVGSAQVAIGGAAATADDAVVKASGAVADPSGAAADPSNEAAASSAGAAGLSLTPSDTAGSHVAPAGEDAVETRPFTVLDRLTMDGVDYQVGDEITLTADQHAALHSARIVLPWAYGAEVELPPDPGFND